MGEEIVSQSDEDCAVVLNSFINFATDILLSLVSCCTRTAVHQETVGKCSVRPFEEMLCLCCAYDRAALTLTKRGSAV
jgi:hypothetical protein